MNSQDHKIQAEYHEFMAEYPWANWWHFEDFRAHKLSGGRLPDPRKSEQFLIKKVRWEVRNGKQK